jgi:hypothetical protein
MMDRCRFERRVAAPRWLIALAALTLMAVLDAPSAVHAQGAAPWCLNGAMGYTFDCRYQTMEQCLATSRGLGGICTQNPRYGVRQQRRVRSYREYRDGWWGW